jgi:hypothetical protein
MTILATLKIAQAISAATEVSGNAQSQSMAASGKAASINVTQVTAKSILEGGLLLNRNSITDNKTDTLG